jgi:putative copper resistance protein D
LHGDALFAMSGLLAATRAVNFACALLVFGEIVFALLVARPAWRDAGAGGPDRDRVERRIGVMAATALVLGLLSSVLWLALEVPLMSGEPFHEAMQGPTLSIVLGETWFGRVWMARTLLALALLAWIAFGRRGSWVSPLTLLLAAAHVAAPALAGHAAGGQGVEGVSRIGIDMAHLMAAGAWLGALPGLALVLAAARESGAPAAFDTATRAAQRFSALGVVSVSVLLATGIANTAYLVRSVAALTTTEYGSLLLAKLALVALMLALAAVNRWWLTPRVAMRDVRSVGMLAASAALETLAGLGVVAIVGVLGITVPAMHPMHHELHSSTSRAIMADSFPGHHHG